MLFMKFCKDGNGTPQGFSQPTEDDNMPCSRITQVCHKKRTAICFRSSLQVTFASPDYLQLTISDFWPFNVVKCCQRNSRDNGPEHSRTKHGVSTNRPNIATTFARRGTYESLLLLNWSSWHPAASATQMTGSCSTLGDSGTPGCSA